MIASAPSSARAAAMSPSSSPRCTPAAPIALARRTVVVDDQRHASASAQRLQRRGLFVAAARAPRVLVAVLQPGRARASNGAVPRQQARGVGFVGRDQVQAAECGPGCGLREFIGKLPVRGGEWDNEASASPPLSPDDRRRRQPLTSTWMCVVCGFIYDEAKGLPEEGLAPGTRWKDIPDTWTCPDCGVTKDDFEMIEVD